MREYLRRKEGLSLFFRLLGVLSSALLRGDASNGGLRGDVGSGDDASACDLRGDGNVSPPDDLRGDIDNSA